MKFRTTWILLAVFVVLLAVVYLLEFRGSTQESEEEKLVSLSSDDVEKIVFKTGEETLTFEKKGEDWMMTSPLEAKADRYEVNRLAEDFADLAIQRVVEETPADLEKYGIPEKEVLLYSKGDETPIRVLIGMENPLDQTFFAQREGETRVVLISSTLKSLLEKKAFDFREKNIFKFETDKAETIRLKAKDIRWEADKQEDEWFLKKPVQALARKSKISDVLYALSNLKAKAFVSEDKTKAQLREYGLEKPAYEVDVSLPSENQKITFLIHKKDDKVFATTSMSPKIIEVADSILTDLETKASDLREKRVAEFFTWEVESVHVQSPEGQVLVSKDKEEGTWHFEDPEAGEPDEEKIQEFLRKMENLEADTFVDPPFSLEDYGLVPPTFDIRIGVKEDEEKTEEIIILVGKKEEKEPEKVYVKNDRLDYLFRVDASFLEHLPQSADDWKKAKEEEKQEQRKENEAS
ncbi:MAG: DUF4340 domain-containing protein [Candidatus Aminicenantales bacterium]